MNVFVKWTSDKNGLLVLSKEAHLYQQMCALQDSIIPRLMGYYELQADRSTRFGLSMFVLYDTLPDLTSDPSSR